jgi:hypothetical protein
MLVGLLINDVLQDVALTLFLQSPKVWCSAKFDRKCLTKNTVVCNSTGSHSETKVN